MLAEGYVQKELGLINPLYFATYDNTPQHSDGRGRWHIRKWKSVFLANHRISNWRFASINILTLRKEDETGNDIGYRPLDIRAVKTVQEGLYWAKRAKILARKIDDSNQYMEENAEQEMGYISRYMAKRIWHYYREPTIILGG